MGRGTAIVQAPHRAAAEALIEAGVRGQLTLGPRVLKVEWVSKQAVC